VPGRGGCLVNRRQWLLLIRLSALWGGAYLLIAVALRGFSPVVVVFGRAALAAAVLLPLAWRRKALRPAPVTRRVVRPSAI
jgi:drug/metabolite transporter (DMT)-like permease